MRRQRIPDEFQRAWWAILLASIVVGAGWSVVLYAISLVNWPLFLGALGLSITGLGWAMLDFGKYLAEQTVKQQTDRWRTAYNAPRSDGPGVKEGRQS